MKLTFLGILSCFWIGCTSLPSPALTKKPEVLPISKMYFQKSLKRNIAGFSDLKQRNIDLDGHFHVSPYNDHLVDYERIFKSDYAKKIILIDDSYQLHSREQLKNERVVRFLDFIKEDISSSESDPIEYVGERVYKAMLDPNSRLVSMKYVSDLTQKYPQKLRGLCGFNADWEDQEQLMTECLNLPGMVGVKIHGLTFYENFKNLDLISRLLTKHSNKIKLVLWHTEVSEYEMFDGQQGDKESELSRLSRINEVLNIVQKNKNIIFVFAHLFTGRSDLNSFIDQMSLSQKSYPNLYADISLAFLDPGSEWNNPHFYSIDNTVVDMMRKFPVDKIIYGSDFWAVPNHIIDQHLDLILNSPLLTNVEKNKILRDNAKKIIEKIY